MKDHLGKPVSQVPVALAEQQAFKPGMDSEDFASSDFSITRSNGVAVFVSNIPADVTKVVLKVRGCSCGPCLHLHVLFLLVLQNISSFCWQFVTADTNLLPASQAEKTLVAVAYQSPNQRYIYIDPPLPNRALQVGSNANIKVYLAMPSYVPTSALSYVVREHRLYCLAIATSPISTAAADVAPPLRFCPKVKWWTLGLRSLHRDLTTCRL